MGDSPLHIPVLTEEVLNFLRVREGGIYFDGTVGAGGHLLALLERVEGKSLVIGVDKDGEVLSIARKRINQRGYGDKVRLFHTSFGKVDEVLKEVGVSKVDGMLLDLGVSSYQVDTAERGFSFRQEGPLDMRMDRTQDKSAFEIINTWSFEQLRDLIREYGEDPLAGRIARAIVRARERSPIYTTAELAQIVLSAYPLRMRKRSRRHPATRTFQALRIAVNGEMEELRTFLSKSLGLIRPGGRLVIISFHSLEDRLVKNFFRIHRAPPGPRPSSRDARGPWVKILTKKPLVPPREEIEVNRRARSAKLRAAEVMA